MSAAAADGAKALLGKSLRCTLSDGRQVEGKLICLDRWCNVLLRDAEELPAGGSTDARKKLGQVIVPGAHLARAEAYA